ncbi:hypothetical protein O6H91_02G042000 [Diphasiastrum complanatum]|uniref:Uncharacterized protein n=1 Tax=Diphasiastrum complanatum TaxID=34168 RepID=A0ACC2EEQ8_DIPCM|nr:hypothetical protein O6H91_02G042000 [Diphasiastrum complanatum]
MGKVFPLHFMLRALLLLSLELLFASAEIRHVSIKDDSRSLIMFEKFAFGRDGRLEITVSNLGVHPAASSSEPDLSVMGFFLATEEALVQIILETDGEQSRCVLENDKIRVLFTLNQTGHYDSTFEVRDANEYTLLFANCQPNVQVSMKVRTAMYNFDGSNKVKDYLPVGETQLPVLYFSFFWAYLALAVVWVYLCRKHKETVHRIHILMGVLLLLKAFNLIAEAEDKLYIRKTGTAHGWDIVFYVFGFLKGVMLFTVIILIGTGWSFLKPFLQDKEKKVLMVVIPLQVFANMADIIIEETGPSTKDWVTWRQLFLLLDIICCCAVLFPIVWSIKHLREASHTDGKAARNLVKLTLFRQYYIVVVSYIYFTRIVVFALTTVTAFQYRWTSEFARELATLAFYIFTGYKFQPVVHNPYFVLDEDEEEAAALEALQDDDFDL